MTKRSSRESLVDSSRAGAEILRDIDEQAVRIDGTTMSKREAQLRILYARALNGDSKASQQLQRARDRSGAETHSQKVGHLWMPEPVGGLALKPSDRWVISLCSDHHIEQHRMGEDSFEKRYGISLLELAAEFALRSPHRHKLAGQV